MEQLQLGFSDSAECSAEKKIAKKVKISALQIIPDSQISPQSIGQVISTLFIFNTNIDQ